jgi:lipid A disaccharide synthetase
MKQANDEWTAAPITAESTARATDAWLTSVYITPKFLARTDIDTEFLQAQSEAETLLRNFPQYLTKSQSYQLVRFLKRLRNRKQRESMPISAAYAVLNIAAKINRQLFAEYRKQSKTAQDKPLANKG